MLKRRYVAIAIAFCLLLPLLHALVASGQGNATVSISAPESVLQGSDFLADVNITEVTDFDGANFDITYDPGVLEVSSITGGSIGGTAIPVDMWATIAPGITRVIVNIPGVSGASGSGSLAQIQFRAIGPAGASTPVSLANGVLGNIHANEIASIWVDGLVSIDSPTPTPTPTAEPTSMWVESIGFDPKGKNLELTVRVANPASVSKARVNLDVYRDGALVAELSGRTDSAGRMTRWIRRAASGEYLAVITSLAHRQYVWDQSEGIASGTYTLGS